MSARTIAIMQPTYLPWVGYFDMIDQCHLFVLLDCVQFDRRSWQQRNRIKTRTGETWLTVPVKSRGRRDQKISEVEIERGDFPGRHARTLQHAYSRAPYRTPFLSQLLEVIEAAPAELAALNTALIDWVSRTMGITTPLTRSSTLSAQGQRVARLISICRAVGATRYLSPQGSYGYIDADNQFADAGIELAYHHYEHPVYPQLHGPFLPYMSAVDLLLNCGPDAAQTMRAGRRPSLTHDEVTVQRTLMPNAIE